MKIKFRDLWQADGMVDRQTYALVGLLGFAIKHNLDRLISTYGFHRPWNLFNYWIPVRDVGRITNLRGGTVVFLGTMLTLSFPFIWVGVVMTLKRLRSARLPASLVVLFFVPFLNLLFFLSLCLLPERSDVREDATNQRMPFLIRIVPDSAVGSAAFSLLLIVPAGIGLTVLATRLLGNYGWGLFVALPFAMGFAAALIYGMHGPRTLGGCVGVACLSVALLGAALFAVAIEGLLCLLMAFPIAIPLAGFGGACGYTLQRGRWAHSTAPAFLSALLIFVPGVQWTEHMVAEPPPIFVVRSSIDVHASPEAVWKQVVAFTRIPPPTELIFRAGVAYPIRAEIVGTGVGAERHCVFSTGTFVEPIQVWDEPRRLKFSVTSNPAAMQEWTPYSHIEPAHLNGFLVSNGGQFLLTPLPGGGTRIEGTTWYRHGLWPSQYWRWWSDAIIHQIHMRVLRHIRDRVENDEREVG